MRAALLSILLFSDLFPFSELSEARTGTRELASTPPRGWNSYDSFSWVIDEQAFLNNAAIVAKKLLPYGYEYVVVDYLWYRNNTEGASNQDAIGFDNIDRWGRPIPDPERWPSSEGGRGFKEVAQKVHDMGLKFGIHVMRGISAQAVNANTPILDVLKGGAYVEDGRRKHAVDVGMTDTSCAWLKGFMSVNTDSGAGEAFLRSLYHQYAEWGVDFVKLDCVFGDDMSSREIITVSKLLKELDRPVVFSLSPGSHASPSMAAAIVNYVNMYRVTGDDWDTWEDVAAHFDVARDFAAAKMIGAQGLNGRSWPDLDMLPLGWLTDPGVRQGPHRKCKLTKDEQKTQMTLWAMVKSPLMFGGDLRNIDRTTFGLITNRKLLDINSHSENNMEFPHVTARKNIRRASRVYTWNAARVEKLYTSNNDGMGLTSCSNENAKGWFISHEGEKNQMCWEHRLKSNNISCLYKRRSMSTLSEEIAYKQEHQGKFQLLLAETKDTCLDASVNRKRTASENTFLSTCKWNANQMWELNDDGTLLSSYSGLCATVERKNSNSPNVIHGVRSWVATGGRGEIYLAFFNLESERTRISADIGDLEKSLGRRFTGTGSCNCSEVWTGTHLGIVDGTLSTLVEPHGCSLFVLNCES
ncbi:uncharacterized protein M6B38_160205 [Iris pallida]|uniref:Alpha-galactosidase n=1 Tax=Iris pallida TaxID=29817 RepID=A0AAX6EZJ4_IRIPA|nr:uncharacterized protein M6B38_160205 [Iris pallida]